MGDRLNLHYKLALPRIAAFSMRGSANFNSSNELIAFGFLQWNLDVSALNENRLDLRVQLRLGRRNGLDCF